MLLRRLSLLLLPALAACDREVANPRPPVVTTPARIPVRSSVVAVPVNVETRVLQAQLEEAIPKTLWTIDRPEKQCVKAARLTACLKRDAAGKCKFGVDKAKVTPDLGCRLIGSVARGPLTLTGRGEVLRVTVPVAATVSVRNLAGAVNETAVGAAEIIADARLSMGPDWQPRVALTLSHDWTIPPGVDLLGRRITFTDKADPKLQKVFADLERDLPRQIRKLGIPGKVAQGWREGFTTLELNRRNPPVWLRVTPEAVHVGGYRATPTEVTLSLAVRARTETFVGDRPPDPAPTPLPPPAPPLGPAGARFHMPVVADYAEVEPVLLKALRKLAQRPIPVPDIGDVAVQFDSVTMFATTGGRLAVGIGLKADTPRGLLAAKGTVWLTGRAFNAPGSFKVKVRDLVITSDTDNRALNLLVNVVQSPLVMGQVEAVLTQDFARDQAKLMAKIQKAIAEKRIGAVVLRAHVDRVANGTVRPYGQGLYMPVDLQGDANLEYAPLHR